MIAWTPGGETRKSPNIRNRTDNTSMPMAQPQAARPGEKEISVEAQVNTYAGLLNTNCTDCAHSGTLSRWLPVPCRIYRIGMVRARCSEGDARGPIRSRAPAQAHISVLAHKLYTHVHSKA